MLYIFWESIYLRSFSPINTYRFHQTFIPCSVEKAFQTAFGPVALKLGGACMTRGGKLWKTCYKILAPEGTVTKHVCSDAWQAIKIQVCTIARWQSCDREEKQLVHKQTHQSHATEPCALACLINIRRDLCLLMSNNSALNCLTCFRGHGFFFLLFLAWQKNSDNDFIWGYRVYRNLNWNDWI